jgi:hypothetical protein
MAFRKQHTCQLRKFHLYLIHSMLFLPLYLFPDSSRASWINTWVGSMSHYTIALFHITSDTYLFIHFTLYLFRFLKQFYFQCRSRKKFLFLNCVIECLKGIFLALFAFFFFRRENIPKKVRVSIEVSKVSRIDFIDLINFFGLIEYSKVG